MNRIKEKAFAAKEWIYKREWVCCLCLSLEVSFVVVVVIVLGFFSSSPYDLIIDKDTFLRR